MAAVTYLVSLAALLAAALFVVRPLVGPRERSKPGGDSGLELIALERRDRALAALSELEFDHRTGKIADADYQELLPALRREAADALRAISGVSA